MSLFGNNNPLSILPDDPDTYQHATEQITTQSIEELPSSNNYSNFISLVIVVFVVLIFRIFFLQVVNGQYNRTLAEGNRIRVKNLPAPRGIIFDINRTALVKNIARYDLIILPSDLPKNNNERDEVIAKFKSKLNFDINDKISRIEKKGLFSLDPIVIKENISQEEAIDFQIELNDLPGVSVDKEPIRQYNTDYGLSGVLGYIGKITIDDYKNNNKYLLTDWIGKTGLEKKYENYIRGTYGQEQVEVDSKGRVQRLIASSPAVQGNNLDLSLDLKLQEESYKALEQSIKDHQASKGVAIALNPKNGEIYSLVSFPSYNANSFINSEKENINNYFNDKNQPLLNRAIAGEYPSGSSIKPVYASAALQEKVISATFAVDTPPEIKIGDFVFPDWKDHGKTDIKTAIAESNNIIFYAIAGGWDKIKGLGIKRMEEYLKKFGYGEFSGIDLPGERNGFVPNPEWKKKIKKEPWYIGDTYHLGIGQGDISVTPIQMAVALSAIANDGSIVTPHLVNKIETVEGVEVQKIDAKVKREKIVDSVNLQTVREGMRQTVESGSARSINGLTGLNGQIIESAGKTGTAQTSKSDTTHAWYIGFAPWQDPKIAVVVLVEDGGEGFSTALPVASQMLKTFFRDDNPALK